MYIIIIRNLDLKPDNGGLKMSFECYNSFNVMAQLVSFTFEVSGAQYKGAKRKIIKLAFRTGVGAEVHEEVRLIRVRVTGNTRDISALADMMPRKLPGCVFKVVDNDTVPIGVRKISETGDIIPSINFNSLVLLSNYIASAPGARRSWFPGFASFGSGGGSEGFLTLADVGPPPPPPSILLVALSDADGSR